MEIIACNNQTGADEHGYRHIDQDKCESHERIAKLLKKMVFT